MTIAGAGALAGMLALWPPQVHAAPPAPASAPAEPLEIRVFRATQPEPLDPVILAAAVRWGHDPFLLKGLLYTESRLRRDIVNPRTGAAGIAQFTASGRRAVGFIRRARGATGRFTQANALDPVDAIDAAAEVLDYLRDRYGLDGALAAYNAGPATGRLVRRLGYWGARDRVGGFLLVVLRHANRLRTEAGLPPLPPPPRRPPKRSPLPTS
jgi:soluble lytic murein transglycosylase-like protein